MKRFAVLDTETTGFGKTDRILEVGIILIDGNEIVQEWETLINPERDISNSNIHGIDSNAVSLAPTFEEVADEILTFISGRILVAHNLPFDKRMLEIEFSRLGRKLDLGSGYCTLKATGMKLDSACEQYGIVNSNAHRALTDARATALILNKVYEDSDEFIAVSTEPLESSKIARTISRSAIDQKFEGGQQNLRRITRNFEIEGLTGEMLSYVDALTSVLSDFELTKDESKNLRSWAKELGLSENEVNAANAYFVGKIIEAANRDNYISELETKLIRKVAEELGVDNFEAYEKSEFDSEITLRKGIRVCFTGSATDSSGNPIHREQLEEWAIEFELIPVASVTKKSCDLLVAADKSSMSGKTKKARDFGVNVISVSEFLELILK
jgi:DNA polymerase III subunit epsilon